MEIKPLQLEPCPACEAKGGWYRSSLKTVSPKHQEGNSDFILCPYCGGHGRISLPSWIAEREKK